MEKLQIRFSIKLLLTSIILIFLHVKALTQDIIEYQTAMDNCHVDTIETIAGGRKVQLLTFDLTCLEVAQLPGFTSTTIEGKKIDEDYFQGKVSVINFWFKGCGPCVSEIPDLNKVQNKFKGERVNFLAINVDDTAEEIKTFISRIPFHFDHIPIGLHIVKDIFLYPGGYPATFVVDQNLKIIAGISFIPSKETHGKRINRKLIPIIDKALKEI